jgi:hypothetical protein
MARTGDYVGKTFGPFRIMSHIGSGAEADTFLCGDERTGMAYVLRLDARDTANWRGAPRLPPRNASVEVDNVLGTRAAHPVLWKDNREARQRGLGVSVVPPDIYGVLSLRYLVPASPAVRVRGAVDVDVLVHAVAPETVLGSLAWREVTALIVMITELVGPPVRALQWWSGTALHASVNTMLASSRVGRKDRAAVLEALSSQHRLPPLQENLLLRLVVAAGLGLITVAQAQATMRCRHFRTNVTAAEIHQIAVLQSLIRDHRVLSYQAPIAFLAQEIQRPPYQEIADADQFEIRLDRDISGFELFLQTPAGTTPVPLCMKLAANGTYELVADRGSNVRVIQDFPQPRF